MATKAELINDAFAQMRISGLTVQPGPFDIAKALPRLEAMAAEWESRNICIAYNFEDEPDVNSASGVALKHENAVATNLAMRLVHDYGLQAPPTLMAQATQGASFVSVDTAIVEPLPYPSRQPVGSRNSLFTRGTRRFYPQTTQIDTGCATKKMYIGDTNDFIESWSSYLQVGEDIASYVLSADTGLTVVSQSLSTPNVNFRINAVGVSPQNQSVTPQVVITVTTTTGRVDNRVIQFILLPVP